MNLSHAGLIEIVKKYVPSEYLESFLAQLQPCVIGDLRRRSACPVGSSRIGGEPDLPFGTPYPVVNGIYCEFLAQINLADLEGFAGCENLPSSGLLSFFYECYSDKVEDSDAFVNVRGAPESFIVRYYDGGQPLRRAAMPQDLQGTMLVEHELKFSGYWSLPRSFNTRFDMSWMEEGQVEMWEEISSAFGRGFNDWPSFQILGHTSAIEDYAVREWQRQFLQVGPWEWAVKLEQYKEAIKTVPLMVPFLQLKVTNALFYKRTSGDGANGYITIGIADDDLNNWRLERMYFNCEF